jgi:hypothetical protein
MHSYDVVKKTVHNIKYLTLQLQFRIHLGCFSVVLYVLYAFKANTMYISKFTPLSPPCRAAVYTHHNR